jgi:hypothetical protein
MDRGITADFQRLVRDGPAGSSKTGRLRWAKREKSRLTVMGVSRGAAAHACNPSYSRGRDREDRGLKPAREKFARPYLEKNLHTKGLLEWLRV